LKIGKTTEKWFENPEYKNENQNQNWKIGIDGI